MHHYLLAALLLCLALVVPAGAQPIPPGTYPGFLIIHPDGSQEVRASVIQTVGVRHVQITHAGTAGQFGTTSGSGNYQVNATVTLTATPRAGDTFAGWSGDPECSATPFPITRSITCIATFTLAAPGITLTIEKSGNGTTTPAVGTAGATAGSTITTAAVADSGWTFSDVTPHPCAVPSFVMPSASITCLFTFTQNPATAFAVTIGSVGTGTGTTGGTGNYLAGVSVHLTAVPAAGSVFAGWSGHASCAGDFVMPSEPVACTATFNLIPPATGAGTWTKLNTGTTSDPQPVSGGFQPWAYDYLTGDLWFYSSSQAGKVYRFNHGTMRWTVTNNAIVAGAIHNCGLAFVGVNTAMYMGRCTPDAGQPGSWVIATASGPTLGVMTYRPTDTGFGRATDPLCIYERVAGVLMCLGGWSNNTSLVEKDVTPFTDLNNWTVKNPTGTKPVLGVEDGSNIDEFTRTTYNRGGYNATTGKLWAIDRAGDVFLYTHATNSWAKTTMGGTKPPSSTVHAYHEPSGLIVGVTACVMDANAVCQGGGQTYLGNVATATWALGPGPTQGPAKNQYWGQNILYNEARQTIQLISHTSGLPPVYEFVPGTTPPSPGVNRVFTVAKTGSGNGTVGGGGTFPDGSVVTATATPDAASQMDGWVEPSCPTFTITADSICTAKLNIKVTVPSGPYPDMANLPKGVFIPVECGPKTAQGAAIFDVSPFPCGGGSKHQRWAADGLGSVWTGMGDTSPSHTGSVSQNQAYKLRLSDGQWSRWNAACRPAGQIMPNKPDEIVWAWDDRGYFWLLGGVTQGSDGELCSAANGESGALMYRTGLFKYTVATDRWTRIEGVAGTNGLWGTFDNTTRNLLYFGSGGSGACGSALFRLNVDTLARTSVNACFSSNPFPGSGGGNFEDFADMRVASSYAFDPVARRIYILGYHNKKVASETVGQKWLHLWSIHIDTGAITQHADPPNSADTGLFRNPDAQDIVFNTVNRRVQFPYTRTHCGVVEGMYAWNPDTNTWTTHSVTPNTAVGGGKVRGNTATYDPFYNVMVVGGSVACADWGFPGLPNITHWFLWQHP